MQATIGAPCAMRFALRGDTQTPARIVDPARQREALAALMAAIQPKELAIPERILAKIPPSPNSSPTGAFKNGFQKFHE